jgi:hypothetical protein
MAVRSLFHVLMRRFVFWCTDSCFWCIGPTAWGNVCTTLGDCRTPVSSSCCCAKTTGSEQIQFSKLMQNQTDCIAFRPGAVKNAV